MAAFTDEFQRHAPQVYAWAYRVLGRHHDALDVAQDVFLRWVQQCRHDPPRQPQSWLRKVTVRRAIDLLRSRRTASQDDAANVPARDGPDNAAALEQLRTHVAELLAELSDPQREVLVARVYDDITFAAIATELSISPSTAKTHYVRALRHMRAGLSRKGYDDTVLI